MPKRPTIALALAALGASGLAFAQAAPVTVAPPKNSLAVPLPPGKTPPVAGSRLSVRRTMSVVRRQGTLIGGGDDFAVTLNNGPEDPREKFERRSDKLTNPDQTQSGR